MAAVHSMLYKSGNFTDINIGEYIRKTAGKLYHSYSTSPQRISLLINAQDVTIPIDTAIPCGLMINELVSNAFKHAFPEPRSGTIRVEMKREGNALLVVFADDGVGFPPGFDVRDTNTLGLKLVNMLVAQLDGRIEMRREGGAAYIITLQI
jgi:two-component system, sensor histidine kinase PdtaS